MPHSPLPSRRDLLRATGLGLFASSVPAQQAKRPNILFILMDDLGYPSLGCFGNKLVPTPHLDMLAAEGVRFTDAYVAPQCTPTRATLLTGQYTARNRMWHVIPWYGYQTARVEEPPFGESLSRDAFTLAKGMKAAGYATACIGKWHLTANSPDGNYTGLNPQASHYYGFDTVQTPAKSASEQNSGDKAVNRFTDESIAFIEKNKAKPWFLYLAHHSIHRTVAAPEELVKKWSAKGYPTEGLNNATYLAAIEHFDAAIGRLLAALDNLGLRENTAVVFLSDNGGVYRSYLPNPKMPENGAIHLAEGATEFNNAPLRAGKGSSYEGGIRVPMIVRWPGVAKPGYTCTTPVHAVDFMPTFFAMAGAKLPAGYVTDGVDLTPLLNGRGRIASRALFWYMPFYDVRWLATPSAIIREGDYKLIDFFGDYIDEDRHAEYQPVARLELFNLRDDIGERNNLASRMPERAAAMRKKLHAWIRNCGSPVPGLNPNYDPARALNETNRRPG